MLKDELISKPIREGIKDAYMEVRAMLMPLAEEAFPGLSDYQIKTIIENIIYQSLCSLEPHQMDEKWGKEELGYIVMECTQSREKNEIPGIRRSVTYREFFPLTTREEAPYFLDSLKKKILSGKEELTYEERKVLSSIIRENKQEFRLLHKILNKKLRYGKLTREEGGLLTVIEKAISEKSLHYMMIRREKESEQYYAKILAEMEKEDDRASS